MEYRLSSQVAEGGEGTVYRVKDRDDVVAKLYRASVPGQDLKLEHLISISNKQLVRVAAWPLSRLRDATDQTVGFVMESLVGWQPLHNTYQVKSRLELTPNRTWRHLVRISRNLATCVHHVHEAGLIVGDLNESNVFVSHEAMVKLLDVDSFQCETETTLFSCNVCKAELLAPELHGHSLEGVRRTENHDLFALAVLIFETLMFGRHPFAGRPVGSADPTLEESIQNGWYVFTTQRKIPVAPPKGLEIDWLPPEIRDLFELAFEPGVGPRPSAKDWYSSLKRLEGTLRSCDSNEGHIFWNQLDRCPWCSLEDRWNLALFRPMLTTLGPHGMDLEKIWAEINAIPAPTSVPPPKPLEATDFVPSTRFFRGNANLLPALPFFMMMMVNGLRHLGSLTPFVFCAIVLFSLYTIADRIVHEAPFKRAQQRLVHLLSQWRITASPEFFESQKEAFARTKELLETSTERLEKERRQLVREAHRADLDKYLSRYSIRSVQAVNAFDHESNLFRNMGIETAADVTPDIVKWSGLRIPAEVLGELYDWRNELEERFWSTSSFRLTPHMDRQAVAKIAREDADYRMVLEHAPEELLRLREVLEAAQVGIAKEAIKPTQILQKHGSHVAAFEAKRR
jgi:DNA-binding helix-hairpin-helix protein with protein kinase domain